jgi:hypothetical protein
MGTHRVFKMSFASVYPHYVQKAEKKGRTQREVDEVVCGVRIEEIEDPLMRKIRYLDKLVDELAKGRPMEKILRE